MTIAGLGFLGLGLTPPTPEWGAMIAEALPYLTEAPWQTAAPCIGLFIVTLSATLIGRAALPKSRDGEA
jgi:peptide/nickel transport system permease protein